MSNGRIVLLLVFVHVALAGCQDSSSGSTSPSSAPTAQSPEFRQLGYLKDKVNNRIFTIAIPPDANDISVRTHAESLSYTSGQMMGAYYFTEGPGIPADGITLAGDMLQANRVLYETTGVPKWRYAYQRSFNGATIFIDCSAEPTADLCNQL